MGSGLALAFAVGFALTFDFAAGFVPGLALVAVLVAFGRDVDLRGILNRIAVAGAERCLPCLLPYLPRIQALPGLCRWSSLVQLAMNALRLSAAQSSAAFDAASAQRSTALTLVRRNLLATRAANGTNSSSANSLANSTTYLSRPQDSYTWSVAVATYGAQGTYAANPVDGTWQASQSNEGESFSGEFAALFAYTAATAETGAAAQYGFYASLSASAITHAVDLYA